MVFNHINLDNLRGDLLGGLTAAIVSLPLALTFGVASGVGAEAGLYGAFMVGLFAALFGGTPTLISEPTGPMTVVMATVVTAMIGSNPDNGLAMAFTVVMMAGGFQIIFGSLRLGKYITLMPYSVVSGFMSGIGLILIIMQMAPILGHKAPEGGATGILLHLPDLVLAVHWNELTLGLLTLGLLYLTPNTISRYLPTKLIALVVVSLVSMVFFATDEIRRIGEITVGVPELQVPTFTSAQFNSMLIDAMILGMLGCIDSMLTSVIADNLTRTEHKSDKELIGQGLGNIFSGLIGGLPGAGATMGTVVNIQSGAKSALSGVFRVLILVIAVFGAAGILELIPLAVLAGIAISVGFNILDWSFIKRAHRVSWSSTSVMYAVMFLTLFVDLIVAVGIGVFVANIIIIDKLSQSQAGNIKAISDTDDEIRIRPEDKQIINAAKGDILLLYLSGTMIFGVAKALAREQAALKNCKAVVVDLSDVSYMDDTMSLAIENVIREAVDTAKEIYLVVKNEHSKSKLLRMGIEELVNEHRFIASRSEALQLASSHLASSPLASD